METMEATVQLRVGFKLGTGMYITLKGYVTVGWDDSVKIDEQLQVLQAAVKEQIPLPFQMQITQVSTEM